MKFRTGVTGSECFVFSGLARNVLPKNRTVIIVDAQLPDPKLMANTRMSVVGRHVHGQKKAHLRRTPGIYWKYGIFAIFLTIIPNVA